MKTIAVLLSLAAAGVLVFFVSRARERPPNIILVSIDSLRPDHLGCYGYRRDTSPNIDRLAREGVLFETAVSSSSWTLPAHASLFTGLPDRVHGCFDDRRWLDGSRLTLAEALAAAGYETVGFFSGPYLHPSFGFAQGFDRYSDCTSYSAEFVRMIKADEIIDDQGLLRRDLMGLSQEDITNPILLREITKWLDGRSGGPFFLFIHMWDVHYDYVPPPPYDTRFDPSYSGPVDGRGVMHLTRKPAGWTEADLEHLKALYDGEIAWTDETLGRMWGELERRGLQDESILAITSDHGEAFYEHGVHGHRWTLFEEEIRIPLVIRYPAAIPAGRRVRQPVRIVDVAPTLLELAGVSGLSDALGRSLVPLLGSSAEAEPDATAVCELNVPANEIHLFALRTGTRKRIYDLNRRRILVFDLADDPGEQSPFEEGDITEVFGLYRDAAKRLEDASRRLPAPGERDTPPISKMTEEQLRSLGYLR